MFPPRLVGIFLPVTAGIVSPTAASGLDSPRAADLNFKGVALLSLTPTGETKLDFGSLDGSTWRSAGTHKSVQVDIQSTIPIGPKGFFGEVSQRDRSGFLAGLLPVRLIGEAREDACSQDAACDTVEFEVVLDSARVSRQTDTLVEVALGASYRTFRRVRFHKGVRSVGPKTNLRRVEGTAIFDRFHAESGNITFRVARFDLLLERRFLAIFPVRSYLTSLERSFGGGSIRTAEASCVAGGLDCGSVDIAGNQLNCGSCMSPQTCGGSGIQHKCGCTPLSCGALGLTCGTASDGCGGTLVCGPACTVAQCFHEDQPIEFASQGTSFGRDGLIKHAGQGNDAFGDTAQREGWYWLGIGLRQRMNQPWVDNPPRELSFKAVLQKLEPNGDGVFVRAPGMDPYGRQTDGAGQGYGFTHDQLVPLVAAMGVWGEHDALQRLWHALPEDIFGKHDFQGHWHNALTGVDSYTSDPCNDIRNRSCSRSGVCGGKPLGLDLCPCEERGCKSNCATQNCHTECPCGGCGDFNCRVQVFGATQCPCGTCSDMNCRIQVCIPGVDVACAAEKLDCERLKAQEDIACHTAEGGCTVQQGVELAACTAAKETGVLLFVDDKGLPAGVLFPKIYALFLRAGLNPGISLFPVTDLAVASAFGLGDLDLVGEIDRLRNQASHDLDYVDQDMNDTAMLAMSRFSRPTVTSELAIASYRSRAHSYGSYFGKYCDLFGQLAPSQCPNDTDPNKPCLTTLTKRIQDGITAGWPPDGPGFGPYGAIRWYNRWSSGANPALAPLWRPIIDDLLK